MVGAIRLDFDFHSFSFINDIARLAYGGLERSSNILSVLVQCFSIACLASVVWLVWL